MCIHHIFEKYHHLHYICPVTLRRNVFVLLSFADFKSCSSGQRKNITIPVTIGVFAVCMTILMLAFLWHKGFLPGRKNKEKGEALYYLKKNK